MAQVFYKHRIDLELGNDIDDNAFKSYECTIGYRSLHRSYNLQRPSVVQRRLPRHLLEAWYFWLGIALLVVSVIFSVSKNVSNLQGIRVSMSDFSNRKFKNFYR